MFQQLGCKRAITFFFVLFFLSYETCIVVSSFFFMYRNGSLLTTTMFLILQSAVRLLTDLLYSSGLLIVAVVERFHYSSLFTTCYKELIKLEWPVYCQTYMCSLIRTITIGLATLCTGRIYRQNVKAMIRLH